MKTTLPLQLLAVQENQHLANNITAYLPGVIFRCRNSPSWTMLYISHASQILTGYTPDELINDNSLTYASLIVAEDRERVWQEVQTAIKQIQHYETIYRINTKSGVQKWVWEKGFGGSLVEGSPSIIEGIIIDITEQKQTELALQKSENRFQKIVNGSIEGILIHRNGKALFANNSLTNMLGYDSADEILALDSIMSLIAPHERKRINDYTKARMTGEFAPRHYEFEALHHDGTIRYMEIESSIMEWDGQPSILSTLFDITKRKQTLKEAEQQRNELAHIDRLSLLGEMAASIAHEINQPLTAITTRCAAARNRVNSDSPDLEKIREALDSIEEQAHRSGEIIQHIRELSKPQGNQHQIIDLASLLEQCITFAKMNGRIQDAHLTINMKTHLPPVFGDPVQIKQVILNLIRNAVDVMEHLPSEDKLLTVSAIQHDSTAVQIAVSDCGIGIDKETEANMFQSFFTTKKTGMGMGLSICRTIISTHNGQLWFSRNPDKGVTFRFTLPVAREKGEKHDDS